MGGRNCCVISCRRKSHDYRGRKIPNGLTFHCFPAWRRGEGEQISRLTHRRRAAWVAAVGRDLSFNHIPTTMRVCSRHFHSGKPAYEMRESDPDWVPSLHLDGGEGNARRPERLLRSVQEDGDQGERRRHGAETSPSHESETAAGAARSAVRPWTEVRSLLLSALQQKTHQRPERKNNSDFRDFFRDALEASLDASSRSRAPPARRRGSSWECNVELNFKLPAVKEESGACEESSSSSSCHSCVLLQRRNVELQEELSRLTAETDDVDTTPVLQPEQRPQRDESAPVEEDDPAWMAPLSPPQDVLSDADSVGEHPPERPSQREPQQRRTPLFNKSWLKMFWFLRYSPTLDQMWCHVCRLHSDPSRRQHAGLIKGSRVFKFHNIKKHSGSINHKDSVARHMLQMCDLQLGGAKEPGSESDGVSAGDTF